MFTEISNETLDLVAISKRVEDYPLLGKMIQGETKFIKDLKMNVRTALNAANLETKEALLIALATAANNKETDLVNGFESMAKDAGASEAEIAETYACTSLLATNNVLYRFRHFTGKESYNKMQAKVRMSIMMKPVLGKEFFELLSLAISAVNGCELCVNAHEDSLIKLGTSEERVFDAIRISSVITGLGKVL